MTAPKDGSDRRVIVDLSFSSAQRQAVNASVSKSIYAGMPFSLKLSTVDIICQALNIVGQKVKIFKVELARAFRQLHVDPFDVKYLGLCWWGAYYVDTSVPFGNRQGTLACVCVTDLLRYILSSKGILDLNYIDDIIGIAPDDVANLHFSKTLQVLNSLGFILNNSKTIPPTSVAVCLGITFNIKIGVLQIPSHKLQEVLSLCNFYLSKSKITKTNLQALIGSLMFLHKAIKPAWLFVNCTLALLQDMGDIPLVAIDEGTHQDLRWFIACAQAVNGTVRIFMCLRSRLNLFVDASLQGLWGLLALWFTGLHCPPVLGGVLPTGRPSTFM
jgi:hypothetical protein